MPLDAIGIAALSKELQAKIGGGRIDKVQQPERDMLLLSLRANGENHRLLLAAGTGNARAHLTRASFENPAEPPMFCMLMRKHLVGARILAVTQPDFERMLVLTLDTYDELGFSSQKQLVVEMIGRSSNVILVGEDGRIIDCMRRVDFAGDALRRLLPGMIYRFPPKQDKLSFFYSDAEQRKARIETADPTVPVDKWLLANFSGLSPLVCRELAYRCGGNYDTLSEAMDALYDSVLAGDYEPCMLLQNKAPLDFSFMEIGQYGAAVCCERYDSFSELLDAFYSRRDQAEQQRRRSHELTRNVRTARDRIARKLASQQEELKRTKTREEVRRKADLITANLYRLKKGDSVLTCEDFYEEDLPVIQIPLDPLKTPQQNAAALYKDYNKRKAAEAHLTTLIAQGEQQLDYLNSVLDVIARAESERDLSDIRRELTETGYLKLQKSAKTAKIKNQGPLRFMTDDGLEVLVGRNNLQNDELTTKQARRTDYWLHVQKVHGSHVILRCDGQEPPVRSLEQAAQIAVYYSQARDGGKVPVDYTMVRFVRKPAGALPGKVIYTDYRTLVAEGSEGEIRQLKR